MRHLGRRPDRLGSCSGRGRHGRPRAALRAADAGGHRRDPGPAFALAGILFFLVPGARVTLWTLGLVRELDQARGARATLAVTEERSVA